MSARIIDGKAEAARLREQVGRGAADFAAAVGRPAGLAVVLVGDDPASAVYVRSKARATEAAGMRGFAHRLPADTTQEALLALVNRLNADARVDGILVQLPLPAHLDAQGVVARIDPAKDVDGLTPVSAGRLALGLPGLVPCTPLGCLKLLDAAGVALDGARALVVGRSILVGKPVAQLLLARGATVTVAHSRTRGLAEEVGRAEVVVAAVGRPEMIRGEWLMPGAAVIDVGINRLEAKEPGGGRLVGDVHYASAVGAAGAITPVPGGVGPMTIACLLRNALAAACAREGLAPAAGL